MGGTSTGEWPKGQSLRELMRGSVKAEQKSNYEEVVNNYLKSLLGGFNNRDTETIQTHIETIKSALEKEIEGSIDLRYGGSVSKHTYVDGLSDIDLLVIINKSELSDQTPQEVLQYIAERLRERLPETEIKIGRLAVTVTFSSTGHQIQLLPSLVTKAGVRISKANGTGWSNIINPRAFAERLSKVNQSNSQRVIPVVKLFKAMNDNLPGNARLSGYHIEALAANAFEGYTGNLSYKEMLRHLIEYASTAVSKPTVDVTGQSGDIDDDLGPENSQARQIVGNELRKLASNIEKADDVLSIEAWEQIVGKWLS